MYSKVIQFFIYIYIYIYIYIFFFRFFSIIGYCKILNIVPCVDSRSLFIYFTFLKYFFINLFIYFWLRWVFVAACGLSLVAVSRGYSSLLCAGFSLKWLLLLRSTGSRRAGFSSCGTWPQ